MVSPCSFSSFSFFRSVPEKDGVYIGCMGGAENASGMIGVFWLLFIRIQNLVILIYFLEIC